MKHDAVLVTVKGVMPTANGCAVFLGNDDKTFVIYVDHDVGRAIQMTLNGVKRERPLTHDLIGSVLLGLGTQLEHIVVNDAREGTFFARILLRMENELGKKNRRDRCAAERLDRARAATKAADSRGAGGV